MPSRLPDELTYYSLVPAYMEALLRRLDVVPFPQLTRQPSADLQRVWQDIEDTLRFGYPVQVSQYVQPGRFYLVVCLDGVRRLVAQNRHQLYVGLAGRTWHPDDHCPTADHLGDCGCLTDS
jgi:hypothetical protein